MKKLLLVIQLAYILVLASCSGKAKAPAKEEINAINLKRGDIVLCGSPDKQFGSVDFKTSCSEKVQQDFDLAVALLHSFEYTEAEKMFARVIDKDPGCAMAYWGVAMSNYHPLWAPPTKPELEKGAKAVAVAQSIKGKSAWEADYIGAIAEFYKDWNTADHKTRSGRFEKAMEGLFAKYPSNTEAAIFYSLALNSAADPSDKTYSKQKKAASILNNLYEAQPNHPGIVHYIIHTYDSPELAELGLAAARKYASVAPSSAHALHMPSHIFTRLGLWEEGIQSNLASVASAKCYAETNGINGHWDEEIHGLDYLVYGYLQKGDNENAEKQLDYVQQMKAVQPVNFKVAYAFASIPARYALENKSWQDAANLKPHQAIVSWDKHPWEKAIIHFARTLGSVHTGNLPAARSELEELGRLHKKLVELKDSYKANQVDIQLKAAEAWIRFGEGKHTEAIKLMEQSAEMEDKTEKHPVTPGKVVPARELLEDLLLAMNKPADALVAYEADLKKHPNRFNGLYGAAMAAEKSNASDKASAYYKRLTEVTGRTPSNRPELEKAKSYLAIR